MRFSLVAASLAAAATAAPLPKNSIDIDGLVGVDTSVKRSAEPDSDLHVGRVNVIVRDGEGVISDAEDAFSKFTDEATSLAEATSKRSAVAEQDAEHNLVSLGNAAVSVKRDAAPEEDTLVSGTLSVGLKRDEISDLEGKVSALLGDVEGLVKRDEISDAESEASTLLDDLEHLVKRDEISDLEGKLSALLGDVEGLVKRDDISDAESAASDLISDAETAIKAAE